VLCDGVEVVRYKYACDVGSCVNGVVFGVVDVGRDEDVDVGVIELCCWCVCYHPRNVQWS